MIGENMQDEKKTKTQLIRELQEARERVAQQEQAEMEVAAAFMASRDMVGLIDINTAAFLKINPTLQNFFGSSEAELQGRSYLDFIHPQDLPSTMQVFNEQRESGKGALYLENRFRTPNGDYRWLEWNIHRIPKKGLAFAMARDITDRKHAEEALRESEARFKGLVDQSPFSVQIMDGAGFTIRVNKEWEKLWGVTLEELGRRSLLEDRQLREAGLLPYLERAYAGESVLIPPMEYSAEKTLGKGSTRWVQARVFPIRDDTGKIREVTLIHEDITDHKKAVEALRESEAKYRSIVETTTEWIWEMDRSGRHAFSNQAIANILGYRADEILGQDVTSFMHPDDKSEVISKLPRLIESKTGWKGWVLRWRHRDGNYRFLESNANPILDAAGELLGYRGADRDITERRQAQELLQNQLRFEKGIAAASACLMNVAEADQNITQALDHLLRAADVARIYLFENFEDPVDGLCLRQLYEVCAPGVHPEIDNPELLHHSYRDGFTRWRELLSKGRAVLGQVADFPPLERELLEPQGIVSILVLPLSIAGRWAGFIGFDETRRPRSWRDEEVTLLGAAADLIGGFMARSRAESALRESEARFKGMVEQSPFSIQIIDTAGKTLQVNREFEKLWGVGLDDFRNFNMFEDRQIEETGIRSYLLRALAGEAVILPPLHFSSVKSLGKGRHPWVRARIFPIRDETGKITEITLMHEDITEHKQTQETLLWTQFAMARARENILWVDHEGQIIYANESSCASLGYTQEELLSLKVFEIDPDFPVENWEQHKQQMREKGSLSFESCHRAKDGRIFPVEVTTNYFEVNGQFCACAFDHDISERKRVEAALRENEKRFRLLVQNSNDIIMILDHNGTPSYVSDQCTRILGYRPAELIGVADASYVHPEDQPGITEMMGKSLLEPGKVLKAEYRFRHQNGEWVHCEAMGCNLLNDPSVQGIVLNVRDITERTKAEQERLKLQEQLQQAMKMEAVGRLAGGVAHDFNNLLTGISGNVQLALMDLKPNDPLAETLAEISKAAESAAMLTRQLLAFSRKQLIEPKVLDLNDLIGSMHKMLKRLIGEDLELQTLPGKNLGAVKIDPGQFEQILVNLAVNSRDAMPNGGKLTIETANVELDEEYLRIHSTAQAGRYVMLAISDTGVGMSEHIKAHLFEPFFTTKEKGKGTGLGLATIYGVVKQAGGNIEVYSEVGKGTTFKIYLPRVEEKAEKLEKDRRALQIPGGTETILLVEDEEIVRNLALKILKRLGYKTLPADSGGDALVLAEQHAAPIHLLLTDVVMPGMNGRQLAERLAKIHPETKVLYSSGYTENAIAHHGVIDKGLNFIGKPYAPRALAEAIRKALSAPAGS